MATYTSTQAGNWNSDATWGGGGHPNANDDVVNIGHAVDYDAGVSSVTWGNVTINSGGMLALPATSSWKMLFNATGILTINDGGELRTGTTSSFAEVDAAYLGQLHWPQGASVRNVLVLNDGGTINIAGDSDFYGSERYAYLDSNWSSGQTFYITGDFSSKWQSGQKFYIHENIDYDNYQNDGYVYTIDTVGSYDSGNDRTPITISEAAPGITFTATHGTTGHISKLIMLSRNLELLDPSTTWDVYDYNSYTERLKFDNNQLSGNELIQIDDAVFAGWDRAVDGGYNFYGLYLVFVSNSRGINSGTNHQVTGDFVSNTYGIYYGTNHQVTGDFVSNTYGIYSGTNHQVTGDFVSNSNGINSGTNHQVTGDFVSNSDGINSGINHQVTGDFVSNTYGIYSGINHQVTGDFVSNSNDVYNITSSYNKQSVILENCELSSINQREYRQYANAGNMLGLISGDSGFQTPDSGNDWIIEVTPNSYCAQTWVNRIEMSPIQKMAIPCLVGSKTLTLKIWPVGWTTPLDQDDVILEILYLDSASAVSRTVAQNTTATYSNGAWRSVSVSFTAGQDGLVYYNLYVGAYESGCTLLIDPVPVIS